MSNGADLRPARVELNARVVGRELAWLERVLQARIGVHFGQADAPAAAAMAAPALARDDGDYAELVHAAGLDSDERLVLALALAPHLKPQLLDMLFVRNRNLDRGFSEFGGWKGRSHGGFLPTCETAAFLVAGEDLAHRFALQRLLDDDGPLRRHGLLRLQHDGPGEPWLSAALHVSGDTLERLATGEARKPDYGIGFPARLITTRLAWSDLVLDGEVMDEVQAIVTWFRHGQRLLRD